MLKRSREKLRRLDEERFGRRRECRHSGEFGGLHIKDDLTVCVYMHACSCFTGITLTSCRLLRCVHDLKDVQYSVCMYACMYVCMNVCSIFVCF